MVPPMHQRAFLPLALALVLAPVVRASLPPAADRLPPPHPSLLYAEVKGERHPVIGAEQDRPVIERDGRRRRLPSGTPLVTERAARYAPVSAEVTGPTITNLRKVLFRPVLSKSAGVSSDTRWGEEFDVELSVLSRDAISDCYLVAVSFDRDSLEDPGTVAASQISIHEVGDLQPGQPRVVRFRGQLFFPPRPSSPSAPDTPDDRMVTFCQLFTRGQEVRTNVPPIAPRFYHQRECALHRTAVAAWCRQGRAETRPVQPFLQIPPLLPSTDGIPPGASVGLTIGADGQVDTVELDPGIAADTADLLATTFRSWLFLPRLKDGTAVASRVTFPLTH